MNAISLLLPHQLFEKNPALKPGQPVFMVEETLFFNQYKFHKQKLVFHRTSMKAYTSFLLSEGYVVTYVEAHEKNADIRNLLPYLKALGVSEIHHIEATDCWFQQRLLKQSEHFESKTYHLQLPALSFNKRSNQ